MANGKDERHDANVAPACTLPFGVISYGYRGPYLVRHLDTLPHSSVCFVADLNATVTPRRIRHSGGCSSPVTKGARDLFACDELDAVVVATPVMTHFSLACAAPLAADVHGAARGRDRRSL